MSAVLDTVKQMVKLQERVINGLTTVSANQLRIISQLEAHKLAIIHLADGESAKARRALALAKP